MGQRIISNATFVDGRGKRKRLPPLTDLQIAALAAARDNDITRVEVRLGYRRFHTYRAHGFNVTCQVHALRRRGLMRFTSSTRVHLFWLTAQGVEILSQHPEY